VASGIVRQAHDRHRHAGALQHGLRHRAEQQALDRAAPARPDDHQVAAVALGGSEQDPRGVTGHHLGLEPDACGAQQRLGLLDGLPARGGRPAFQDFGVRRQDQLVQVGRLLRRHHERLEPRARPGKFDDMVHCRQRPRRSVHAQQHLPHHHGHDPVD
jgi:hypothetical protein